MTTNATVEARAEHYAAKPREQRDCATPITLRTASTEARAEGDGTIVVEGYAAITDVAYTVRDWLGEYDETMQRGAFGKTLRDQDDVRWLINHDGVALARTASGTLDLREITKPEDDPQSLGQTGLWTSARLDPMSPLAQTARSAIERGDMSQMSFSFMATRQEWNEDYTERAVIEARLFDVSAVTYPANPATSVAVGDRAAELDREQAAQRATDEAELNRRRHKLAAALH